MERKEGPLYETTTKEGTRVEVAATVPVPTSGEALMEKAKNVLAEGSLPSNEQIDKNLSDAQKTLENQIRSGNLDDQGKLLAKDAEDIINVASKALHEKNKDEKLQKLFEDTRQAVQENQPVLEKNAEIIKEKGQKVGEKIKGAAKEERGKIQNKGQNVSEEVQKEGEKIKDKAQKIGDTVKDKGEKLGKEAKEMAKDIQPQAEKLKDDTQELLTSLKNFFWNFIKSDDFRGLIADWVSFIQFLGTKKVKEGAKKLQESEKTGEATTNIAKGIAQGLQQTKSKKNKEQLEQKTEDKFYELLGKIKSKPEYQQAFRDLLKLLDIATEKLEAFTEDVIEESKDIAKDIKEEGQEIMKDVQEKGEKITKEVKKDAKDISKDVKKKGEALSKDVKKEAKRTNFESLKTDSFWKAIYDARDVLGEFTGREELDKFVDTLWDTYTSVRDDDELNRWFWDFRNFVSELLEDVKQKGPEVLEDAKQQGQRIAKDIKKEAKGEAEEVKQKGKKLSKEAKKKAKQEKRAFDAGQKDAEDVKNSAQAKGEALSKEAKKDTKEVTENIKQKGQAIAADAKSEAKRLSEKALPEERRQEAKGLFYRGRKILKKDKWSNQFDLLSKQFNILLENIKNDTTTLEFGEKIRKFAQDFALNKQGRPDLYVLEDSFIQMKNLLIPLVKDQLAHIKIGRVEFHNETYDVKIEDIGFSGSFLPEHIDFHLRNDAHLDTSDSSKDMMRNILSFSVSNIKPEFRNFKFYYRRKTFPKIEDWGVADLKLSGAGAAIYITWSLFAKGGESPVAKLAEVKCTIDKLDWHISGKETHHDILDKMLLPFVSGAIKNKVSGSIEDLLRTKLGEVNARVNEFFQSKPLETLKDKTNEAMQQQFQKFQQEHKAVNAI
jgi:hypothetical protein